MIPIKLSIQGLYSYQELQEIDFQQLIGSSVFGIFGKVGSGKTSVLEAISFALYGETERLNSRDNRQYNMMNLKSKHLIIDFEFQAGADQQLYKFVYEAKRHPKKHHEIGPGERRMFVRENTEWKPIGNEKEDIAVLSKQILGLDYDNFKRTIIIPQNQFREFLELSPVERTKMMNQLFKLDQYDLAARVSRLSKANDDQLAELRGLLSPLEAVTPEAIEQAEVNIDRCIEAIKAKEIEIAQLEPTERNLIHAQTQSQLLISVQRELASLQTLETSYGQLRQTIALYETCRLVFRPDLMALRKLQDKQTGLLNEQVKATKQLASVNSQLPGLQSVYDATKRAYEGREQLQQQIDELETVQSIRTLQETVGLQITNRQHVVVQTKRKKSEVDDHKAERAKQQALIDSLIGQTSQLDQLYQVEKWFVIYKPLKKQAEELQIRLDDNKLVIERIKKQKDNALAGFPEEWSDFTLKTLPTYIDTALEQLKAIRKERDRAYQQALVKQELARYTDSLTDGMPCPLCGSEHHPARYIASEGNSDADLTRQDVLKSEKALDKVNQRIEDTTALRLSIEGLAKELRAALDNEKRLIQERTEIVRQLTEHEDGFVWHDFDKGREDDLTVAIRKENEQQKQLQDRQKSVRDLTKKIEAVETSLQEEEKTLSTLDNAIAGINGQLQTAVESLAYYRLTEIEQWNLRQITDLRDSLTQTHRQAKTNFESADKERSDMGKLHATLTEQHEQVTRQLADLTADIQALTLTITQNLTQQNLTQAVVDQVLQSDLDPDKEKQRIREYDNKRAGLQKQIDDLKKELFHLPFDHIALTTVQSQLKTLGDQKDALNKEHGRATSVLASLEKQWQQKLEYQKRHDDLDLRRADLKKMDEMFRAQGFVNYVSSVYLKNLCESANERFFKLTNNQLKLELDDKNNFLVRDYLNSGEVRSVKTLSGGQTFQAALSLALALSDNIQHLTKAKQNLFFLDEGFGTLDKDSLQTVFKTLKALRSENRVVGIISHVEELQQEVDNFIRAESTENGSRIVRSWES